jgi:hypothetical protein
LERLVSMDLWALWINPRKLHLPTLISKWKHNTKCVSKKQCPSLQSTWQRVNLYIQGLSKTNKSMEYPLQHPWNNEFGQYLFVHYKFFTYKMRECDNLLDHINEVKALVNMLTWRCMWETKMLSRLCLRVCQPRTNI